MEFYKMVVKAISGLNETQERDAQDIKFHRKLSTEEIEKELNALNKDYLRRTEVMLANAAEIANYAEKDWRFD